MRVTVRRASNGWIVEQGVYEHVFVSWDEVVLFLGECFRQR